MDKLQLREDADADDLQLDDIEVRFVNVCVCVRRCSDPAITLCQRGHANMRVCACVRVRVHGGCTGACGARGSTAVKSTVALRSSGGSMGCARLLRVLHNYV